MLKRDVLNKLLLMRLIELSNGIHGRTRLQKLVFETEAQSRKHGINDTFNYKFIRWHYGPYAKEVTDDLEFLIKKGLVIEESNKVYRLTTDGHNFVINSRNIINQFFNGENIMKDTITAFDNKNLKSLLTDVYDKYEVMDYKMGEVIEDLKYVGV